jgi:hypothetical protein
MCRPTLERIILSNGYCREVIPQRFFALETLLLQERKKRKALLSGSAALTAPTLSSAAPSSSSSSYSSSSAFPSDRSNSSSSSTTMQLQAPVISWRAFTTLCSVVGIQTSSNVMQAALFLSQVTGTIVYFAKTHPHFRNDSLKNWVILDPHWVYSCIAEVYSSLSATASHALPLTGGAFPDATLLGAAVTNPSSLMAATTTPTAGVVSISNKVNNGIVNHAALVDFLWPGYSTEVKNQVIIGMLQELHALLPLPISACPAAKTLNNAFTSAATAKTSAVTSTTPTTTLLQPSSGSGSLSVGQETLYSGIMPHRHSHDGEDLSLVPALLSDEQPFFEFSYENKRLDRTYQFSYLPMDLVHALFVWYGYSHYNA